MIPTELHVKISIRKTSNVKGWDGETLYIDVNAPPIDGQANKRLIDILAEWLGIPKSKLVITKGLTARHKTIRLVSPNLETKLLALPQIPRQIELLHKYISITD